MRHAWLTFLLAGAACPALAAADKPLFAPAPAWVRPVAVPPTAAAAGDDAPVRIILSDQQVSFEPTHRTIYAVTVMAIQTAQGLAAGNISLPWSPDNGTLTVHALRIHRGASVIDVLAGGQTFTVVRRESNLENATLDGVLTANIQPEGLQVGDRLEVATSLTTSDPTLGSHAEMFGAAWNGLPIDRAHLSIQWPTAMPVRLRAAGTLPVPRPVRTGAITRFDLQQDGVQPLVLPRGAPMRYQIGRLVEATDYPDWATLAAALAPLYRTAAVIPATGPLQAELARIRALSTDPRVRTEAALALVQDRVRYVALAMGAGGLVPATAAETWARRYGDCKGKTALLLALLAALDVPAEPVVVSTVSGDGLDARLPMVALFDHVLVRATVAGKSYWLDGTRTGDTAIDRITVPNFGWGLPLRPTGAALVRMVPSPPAQPLDDLTIRIDATAGLTVPAPVRIEQVFRGDMGQGARLGMASLSGEARDRALRDYWKQRYDFIDATTTTASFDPRTGEQRFVLEGKARMDWNDYGYETDGTGIGYKADFTRDPGPDREAPFAVPYPYHSHLIETILLPPGFERLKAGGGSDVDRTIAGIAYRRTTSLKNNVFTVEKTERSVAPEFAFSEGAAAQAALRALAEQAIHVRKPADYRATGKEIDTSLATEPTTVQGYLDRGSQLLGTEQYPLALDDFEAALRLDPKSMRALALRGQTRMVLQRPGADKDIAAAAAIDPHDGFVLFLQGRLAMSRAAYASAVTAFSASIEARGETSPTLISRAWSRYMLGEFDAALADLDRAEALAPNDTAILTMRAQVQYALGRHEAAAATVAAMATATPNDLARQRIVAQYYEMFDRPDDAVRAHDRVLALKPTAGGYVQRYNSRAPTDLAGRRSDIAALAKRGPLSGYLTAQHARMLDETGSRDAALALLTAALARKDASDTDGERMAMLLRRGMIYAAAGDAARAAADFKAARARARGGDALNTLCAAKGFEGVALETALSECDAALRATPDSSATLDSRGLVLFRLGRYAAARADYDRALELEPGLAHARYGRALVRARMGDTAGAAADAAFARRAELYTVRNYERKGLTL